MYNPSRYVGRDRECSATLLQFLIHTAESLIAGKGQGRMHTQSQLICGIFRTLVAAVAFATFASGCGSDDKGTDTGTDTDPVDYSPNVDDDVANSLAATVAADNGGVADQLVDIVSLASTFGLRHTNLVANFTSPSYNFSSRTWEWSFAREYTSANGLYYAMVERSYQWRFLKKNGQQQFSYIVASDTAYTIELTIVSGAGRHLLPFLSQTLDSLSGQLVATGTNTDEITVNGTWFRSALDTIRTRYAVRTLDHACSLTVSDLRCQRDTTSQPWHGLSGSISGNFSADIHFASGDAYSEDSVYREFNMALDTGMAAITISDTTWISDLRRGNIQLPPESE